MVHTHVFEGVSKCEAARRAGYSDITADKKSGMMFKKLAPYVDYLAGRVAEVAEKEFNLTAERVIEELQQLAFWNWKDYIRVVRVKGVDVVIGRPIDELTREQAAVIQSWTKRRIDTDSGPAYDYTYTMSDKHSTLIDLGKHLGMFNERLILEGRINVSHDLDLSKVPTEVLVAQKRELEKYGTIIEGEVEE